MTRIDSQSSLGIFGYMGIYESRISILKNRVAIRCFLLLNRKFSVNQQTVNFVNIFRKKLVL